MLDKKIEEARVEHAAEVQTQVAVAAAKLAARETALSASERETYRGFLEKAYFTKNDFGKLEEFYTHSYDRLSEGGKDEMSNLNRFSKSCPLCPCYALHHRSAMERDATRSN